MVLHLQAMVLPVATEGFSSYPGIKKTKTKIRGMEAVMAEVEETCVTAMVLPLLAMGLPPMLLLHHIVVLLLPHLVLLLLLYPPPPAPQCMKHS